jgi:DNA-directed RNA polymerase sigma subunit (sigma70/sigma32)
MVKINKWNLDGYLDILELRYSKGLTLKAIGKEYGVTQERARQVVLKAKRFVDAHYRRKSISWELTIGL